MGHVSLGMLSRNKVKTRKGGDDDNLMVYGRTELGSVSRCPVTSYLGRFLVLEFP